MDRNHSISSNSSLHLNSVCQETKERFDALLKNALKQNKITKNKRKPNNENEAATIHKSGGDSNFILEKFLSDAVSDQSIQQDHGDVVGKAPVPLPRASKNASSIASDITYNVSTPKIMDVQLLDDLERLSNVSAGTYDISKGKPNGSNASSDDVVVPIGDIVIHDSPQGRNVIKIIKSNDSSVKNAPSEFSSESADDIVDNKILDSSDGSEHTYTKRNIISDDDSESTKRNIVSDAESSKSTTESHRNLIKRDVKHLEYLDILRGKSKRLKERLRNVKSTRKGDKEEVEMVSLKNAEEKSSVTKKRKKNKQHEENSVSVNQMGMHVYRTDQLKLNSYIRQPIVKVHVVNSLTGEYIVDDNGRYLTPKLTNAYNFEEQRSFVPNWDETVVFDLNYDNLMDGSPVIIFFEILDLLSFSLASSRHKNEGPNCGWLKIAWAFLKPIGKNGSNMDKKLRLQLYQPKNYNRLTSPKYCDIYRWFLSKREKYPGTLYVSVRQHSKAPNVENPVDNGAVDKRDDNGTNEDTSVNLRETWSKLSQYGRIPNVINGKIKSGLLGAFIVRFSPNGVYVACDLAQSVEHQIIIYTVADNTEYCKFSGHQGLIYDLCWSHDSNYLISASADYLVCVWNVLTRSYGPQQILPHPSFVYCVHVNSESVEIVTGCYDNVVRVWTSAGFADGFELSSELDCHKGFVTSVAFHKDGKIFYTSDSVGVIIEWIYDVKWCKKREFKFRELQSTIINNLIMHPTNTKILICCRDSVHKLMDLKVGCLIQWYRGSLNYRKQLTCCISKCGNLIFAPSEDGSVYVWNLHSGVLLASFTPYKNDLLMTCCVQCHPFDNIVALSHYGAPVPVLLLGYDERGTGKDIMLKDYRESVEETKVVIQNYDRSDKVGCSEEKCVDLKTIIEKMDLVLKMVKN